MTKIAIIGSAGAGKSTLAKSLSENLQIKVYYLDRLFWWSDWERKSKDTRIDILQNLVLEKQWIIDGDYLNTSELHLEGADTVIFLGLSPFLCLMRLIVRHRKFDGHTRRDMPMGSKDKLSLALLLKVLLYPFLGKRRFIQKLKNYKDNGKHKAVILLHSKEDVDDFLVRLAAQENTINGPTKKPYRLRSRQLALARR